MTYKLIRVDITDSTTVKAVEFQPRTKRAPWTIVFCNGLRANYSSFHTMRYELRNGYAQYAGAESVTRQLMEAHSIQHNAAMELFAAREQS